MIILALIVLCGAGCLVYFLRQAHKQAMRDRTVFDPLPQSPSDRDLNQMSQQLIDMRQEAEWRAAVAANEQRKRDEKPLSCLLVKQGY